MAHKRIMAYRRKREGRTDYHKRLVLLKSGLPRLVIRASNKSMQAQVVVYDAEGDKVIATARATELAKHGWKGAVGNIPAAYLTGMLLAHRIKMAKHKLEGDIILDIGLQRHHKGGRLYAVAKGALDAGLDIRIGDDVLPDDDRANGAHINEELAKQIEAVKNKLSTK